MGAGSITDVPGIRVGQAERVGDGWLQRGDRRRAAARRRGGRRRRPRWRTRHPRDRPARPSEPGRPDPRAACSPADPRSAWQLWTAWCSASSTGRSGSRSASRARVRGPGRAGRGDLRPRPWRGVPQHSRTGTGRGCVRRGVRRRARGQPRRRRRCSRRRPQGRRRHRAARPCGRHVVGALAVVDAAGSTVDLATVSCSRPGTASRRSASPPSARPLPSWRRARQPRVGAELLAPRSRRLVALATDATLTKAQCQKVSGIGHDGLARAINPVHTMFDGDTVFTLATCARDATPDPVYFHELLVAAADCVTRAVARAVLAAESTHGLRSYRDASRRRWPEQTGKQTTTAIYAGGSARPRWVATSCRSAGRGRGGGGTSTGDAVGQIGLAACGPRATMVCLAPGGGNVAANSAALGVSDRHRLALGRAEQAPGPAEVEWLGLPAEHDGQDVRVAGQPTASPALIRPPVDSPAAPSSSTRRSWSMVTSTPSRQHPGAAAPPDPCSSIAVNACASSRDSEAAPPWPGPRARPEPRRSRDGHDAGRDRTAAWPSRGPWWRSVGRRSLATARGPDRGW